ncbi:NUDIX domain-containing protein [Exiguobacterium sp. s191]|uniref:NUDIX hydrolase n=1 Tax=Exiguobacterium sp. s191 TaxID=2751196 RepID=UPI001BEA6280|nr:NUDIX domain-containing protein [Exiguobacterium sp. s191]
MDVISFGQKENNQRYITRPAVYAVMFNRQLDKIAIIQKNDGKYFLPGGGIDAHETHEDCLKREVLEETGLDIEISAFIGRANRYFYSHNECTYYLGEGYFYVCHADKKIKDSIEENHFLRWINPSKATEDLFHEHQRWAVRKVLEENL